MALTIDFLPTYDRKTIAAELRRIAGVTGKNHVSARDIRCYGRVSDRCVIAKFGSLRSANTKAGLDTGPYRRWTTPQLLKAVAELWRTTDRDCGRSPLGVDVKKYGLLFSAGTVAKRFGSWKKALLAVSASPGAARRSPLIETTRKTGRRNPIPVGRRYQVFQRDTFTCRICKRSGVPIEVDHIIPVSKGGSDLIENLQTLCARCNRGKSNRM
jgi:hypothetical protein